MLSNEAKQAAREFRQKNKNQSLTPFAHNYRRRRVIDSSGENNDLEVVPF